MPVDEATKNTKGYAFIEFSSAAEAAAAQEQTDGYKLDKQHVFKARACASGVRCGLRVRPPFERCLDSAGANPKPSCADRCSRCR